MGLKLMTLFYSVNSAREFEIDLIKNLEKQNLIIFKLLDNFNFCKR